MLSARHHELFSRRIAAPSISGTAPRHDQGSAALARLSAERPATETLRLSAEVPV